MSTRLRAGWVAARQSTMLSLLCFVTVAVLLRIPYLPGNGFHGDLGIFQSWVTLIQDKGLFHFYERVIDRPYPPLSIFLLATNKGDFLSIKLPSLIAELLIIVVAAVWLRREPLLRWLIPTILSLHPGLILTTAWWGQNDALFTLAIVLMLVALNRNRPLIAWVLFGIALATKQQSLVVIPLITILSFRRYGWQRTAIGITLALLIVGGLFLPFILASGPQIALSSYSVLFDSASSLTNNAFNLWFVVAKITGISINTTDSNSFLAGLSYHQVGFWLLVLYTLVICVVMWKQAHQRREFIWAAALYLGTFSVQTQIHERYLYPASVLALLAIRQERRMWPIALVLLLTFTYNLIYLAVPTTWLGLPLVATSSNTLLIALLNLILLFELLWMVIRPLHLDWGRLAHLGRRMFFQGLRLAAALLLFSIFLTTSSLMLGNYAVSQWLAAHVADHTRIAVDKPARYTVLMANRAWDWQITDDVTEKDSLAWLGDGVQYLVADLTDGQEGDKLALERTIPLYEYQSPLKLSPDLSIMWAFRPDYPLHISFDDSLQLVGYNLTKTAQKTSILFHWYTQQITSVSYTAFIHLVDPQTDRIMAQADTPLGAGSHPTNTWRQGELVFERVDLPPVNGRYLIRFGLYDSEHRAAITDLEGNSLGDHIDIQPASD